MLDVVCISDNTKYFAFEGPNFAEREKRKKQDAKGEKKEVGTKKNKSLFGGILDAKAEVEKAE